MIVDIYSNFEYQSYAKALTIGNIFDVVTGVGSGMKTEVFSRNHYDINSSDLLSPSIFDE